ncbi:MAG: phosphatase PAP2 family protein [Bacteroidota bacterium]|nr:phosphatase PAP2 family protein [Bacteroidota bacterium]
MKFKFRLLFFFIASLPSVTLSQQSDSLISKLDSLSFKTDSAGGQTNNIAPKAYNYNTQINFKSYFILLGSDIKQSFTKPFHTTGKDWGNLGKFALVTGALSFADEPIQKGALKLRGNHPGLVNVSKYITDFGGAYEGYTLAAFGAYGFIFNNKKMQTATLLATQAYIAGAAVGGVTEFLSGRTRPSYYTAGTEAEPKFLGPFSKTANTSVVKKINSSFPSGHTTVSFAAATVFAMEYRDKPIVPIIAYSAATMIGLSRISENKHWATDVLVGAALGILTGREVVNNYHRYSKLKDAKLKKNTVTFNLNYYYGHFEPGLIYKFN